MEDLVKLPFNQSHLLKAPEIVETIRKVNIHAFKFDFFSLLISDFYFDYYQVSKIQEFGKSLRKSKRVLFEISSNVNYLINFLN